MRRWVFDATAGNGHGYLGVEGPAEGDTSPAIVLEITGTGLERSRVPYPLDAEAAGAHIVRSSSGIIARAAESTAEPGVYHPRIYHPVFFPSPLVTHPRECLQSVQAAHNIFVRLREVLRVVEPECKDAYGHAIRELLLLACTEVESSFRSVLIENGYAKSVNDPEARLNMSDYSCLARPMRLGDWRVRLAYHHGIREIAPFRGWGRRGTRLAWYEAHHRVKHNREANFSAGSLRHAVAAAAAVYVMLCAQFGPLRWRASPQMEIPQYENTVGWSDEDFVVVRRPCLVDSHYWPPHIRTNPWDPAPFVEGPWIPKRFFDGP